MSPITLRVRELRKARGMTQAELAKMLEVRRATISDLERGKTRNETLELIDKLCKALRCDPADLFDRPRLRRSR